MKKTKGFTLVELIVVIAVLALLAVGAVMAIIGVQNNARNAAARSSANELANHLNTVMSFDAHRLTARAGVATITAADSGADRTERVLGTDVQMSGWSAAINTTPPTSITWRMYMLNEPLPGPYSDANPYWGNADYTFTMDSDVVNTLLTGAPGFATAYGAGTTRYLVLYQNGAFVVQSYES
ncbi:MAG: prepilin-type N-terminal cleavage/methylation domain-containing protein [Defluviitaleaceae bacterium]|nr:prepilin-type N-terminal cleavage/methylation domain-containing protein [Defluviitaleaceae bacterium]